MAGTDFEQVREELGGLRGELDRVDEVLLNAVRDRLACCVRIAALKREHGVPMMQPARIEVVQQRAADYGEAHGVDGTFLRRLYDLLIAEACRLEDEIIDGPKAAPPDERDSVPTR